MEGESEMSALYNQQFVTNPIGFINNYSVDVMTWFEGLVRTISDETLLGKGLVSMNNRKGWGFFDLEPVGGLLGHGISTVEMRMAYGGLDAYWVPYHSGLGLPGYAEVKRISPDHPFVFTPGMNGCAFVVTDSPKGPAYMRVYHNQLPSDASVWQDIHGQGRPVISFAGPDDYIPGELGNRMPIAFNFLYYRNGGWNYVFQPQAFNARILAPAQRLIGQASSRSVF
jgi:hypothetical protein